MSMVLTAGFVMAMLSTTRFVDTLTVAVIILAVILVAVVMAMSLLVMMMASVFPLGRLHRIIK
jgi:hypothetical protein